MIRNILKSTLSLLIFGDKEKEISGRGLLKNTNSKGLVLYTEPAVMNQLRLGKGEPAALIQTVVLQMLQEQGAAEALPNGYRLASETVVALDDEQVELLQLPPTFSGSFGTRITGHTRKSSFNVQAYAVVAGEEYPFQRKGPYITLGGTEFFRLRPAELIALTALEHHQSLLPEGRNEAENLRLMALLQTAKRSGVKLDLSNFDSLDVIVPEEIGVTATRLPDGSLELCPALGDGSTPDQLDTRWSQLNLSNEGGVLRVENRLVLLEPEKMLAVREVLGSKRIPPDKVEEFIQTPSAFIDASLVNLDLGFSLRVLGVGKLQHMDFGPLDDKKRDWFATGARAQPPEALSKSIRCEEELDSFKQKLGAAKQQGAGSVEFNGEQFDISDDEKVEQVLTRIEQEIKSHNQATEDIEDKPQKKEQVTVLLREAEEISDSLRGKAKQADGVQKPDWSSLLRTPYHHQREGIEWMLGLLTQSLCDDHGDMYRVQGALLADDMGLGKTYMTLVMLAEYLRLQKASSRTQKPVLVVAPLSLLENWEQEIQNTFKETPFRDVKVLQSGRDLKEFRIQGADRESVQLAAALDENEAMNESDIRYALQIGSDAGVHRLDMDRRLVLTTYQTLRDYQFSMCVIDWGVVVFDEAQNIKNPNTLQTRAAKGLKSDFKLLATGTPVENSLGDFWCLMDTAQPGLLGTWQHFRDQWITPISKASEEGRDEVRRTVGAQLRDAVDGFMLRRIKEDQLDGLPEKYIRSGLDFAGSQNVQIVKEMAVVMQGAQLAAYDAVLDEYREQAATEDMRGQALTALQKLRSVSLHPRLSDSAIELIVQGRDQAKAVMSESAKLKVLLKQLDNIRSLGEKVILFLVTKQMQRLLKLWLDQIYGLNIHIINGDTAAVQTKKDMLTRKGMIEDFEAVQGFNIIIMSPVAAGVGLTIVGANHVIHVERHWNPAKEAQATDRVYRIGQTRDVYVHLPAALHPEYDSFDVNLDRLLGSKLMLKDAVVTPDVVSESEMVKSMGL